MYGGTDGQKIQSRGAGAASQKRKNTRVLAWTKGVSDILLPLPVRLNARVAPTVCRQAAAGGAAWPPAIGLELKPTGLPCLMYFSS